jgi:carboxymethylenebutenolidase
MGGGWSLQASIMAGKQGVGCVMYYGMPEKDTAKIKLLAADVYGIFGKKDQWINEAVVTQFKQDMEKAGKKFTYKWYDADHAFANPSNPKFDKTASEDARKNVIAFLRTRLK